MFHLAWVCLCIRPKPYSLQFFVWLRCFWWHQSLLKRQQLAIFYSMLSCTNDVGTELILSAYNTYFIRGGASAEKLFWTYSSHILQNYFFFFLQGFPNPIGDFIHCIYIACWIIIAFAAITFLILLVLSPWVNYMLIIICNHLPNQIKFFSDEVRGDFCFSWLKPDRTWAMHMCVCASVIVTFVLLMLGLASYNNVVRSTCYSVKDVTSVKFHT